MYIDKYKKENGYYDEENCFYSSTEAFKQVKILGFCMCGDPESNLEFIRDTLIFINGNKEIRSFEERENQAKELFKTREIRNFVFYVLDEKGLTEHGSCIPGWLTEKGKHLLDDLNEYFNKNKE